MSVRVHFPYLCLYIQKRAGLFRPSAKLTEREREREGEEEREREPGVLFHAVDLPHDFILISSLSEPFLLY